MQRYFDVVQSRTGDAIVGGLVYVYISGTTTLATLYADNGVTLQANPVTTNSDGEYAFYAANGTYTLQITATNYATETKPGVVLFDPSDNVSFGNNVTLVAGTANGVLYLNGSKVVTSGSALVFDGTNLGIGTSSPGYKLSVNGDTAVLGQNTLRLQNSDNTNAYALQNGGATGSGNAYLAFVQTGVAERMRIDASGNVGVGTSTPGNARMYLNATDCYQVIQSAASNNASLSLAGNAAIPFIGSFDVQQGPTGVATLINRANAAMVFYTNNVERMRLDASGNLGLGVTPSAWSGVIAMQLPTGASLTGFSNTTNLVQNAYYNGSWRYISTAPAALAQVTQGAHQWFTAPSGTANNTISFTQAMTLDASGNLGLGVIPSATTAPLFQIANSSVIAWTDNNVAITGNAVYNSVWKYISTSYATSYKQNGGQHQWSTAPIGTAGNNIPFSQVMTLDASGNLGIGTTSPGANLQIGASTSGSQVLAFAYSATSAGSIDFQANGSAFGAGWIQHDAASGALRFATAGSERMRITSAGNVVAGASAALATTATDGFLYVPTCAGTPTGTPTTITGMAPIVVNTTNNKLYFYSGGAWRDAGP